MIKPLTNRGKIASAQLIVNQFDAPRAQLARPHLARIAPRARPPAHARDFRAGSRASRPRSRRAPGGAGPRPDHMPLRPTPYGFLGDAEQAMGRG